MLQPIGTDCVKRKQKIYGDMENKILVVPSRTVLFYHAGACQHHPWWTQMDFTGWRHRSNVDRVSEHCHGRQQGSKREKGNPQVIPNHLWTQSPGTFGSLDSTQGLILSKDLLLPSLFFKFLQVYWDIIDT